MKKITKQEYVEYILPALKRWPEGMGRKSHDGTMQTDDWMDLGDLGRDYSLAHG